MNLLAACDGRTAIKGIIDQMRTKYNLPWYTISGVLAEILAETRSMELTEIMLAMENNNKEQPPSTERDTKN